jgi:nitrite reductase/ring-hydroxylating ferredoxin subunit
MDAVPMGQVSEVLIEPGQVPEGELVGLRLGEGEAAVEVLACRRGEALSVWLNACPHAGRRLDYAPGRFLLHAGRLVCAAHGAQFELDGGRCVEGPGRGGGLVALAVRAVPGGWWVDGPGG